MHESEFKVRVAYVSDDYASHCISFILGVRVVFVY